MFRIRFTAIILVLAATSLSCQETDKGSSVSLSGDGLKASQTNGAKLTTIAWKESSVNYGKIAEGQHLEVTFPFKNTGTEPLIITKVVPGCGCTVAETPSKPILPGEEGVIRATFDSRNRVGTQHKTIFVGANTKDKAEHELVFEVEVEKRISQ